MSRKEEAAQWLREGLYPFEIACRMGISTKSVVQYLRTRVGEGVLRLSDLYFSWPPEKREALQAASQGRYPDDQLLAAHHLCRDDLELFQSLRRASVFRGDLYEYISSAEVGLHQFVRAVLEREFGVTDDGWWRQGVPSEVRAECAARREKDDEPCESAYSYTTLIHLVEIIAKNWRLFAGELPSGYRENRKVLESDLRRLNGVRNTVMHPVKAKQWSEDDFVFVRRMCELFHKSPVSQ